MELIVLLSIASQITTGCPLSGTWRTDLARSEESVMASTSIRAEQKRHLVDVLEEFEWQIDCEKWTITHVGNHPFPKPVPDEILDYVWSYTEKGIFVEFSKRGTYHSDTDFVFDEFGCIKLTDKKREYTEYKCKIP